MARCGCCRFRNFVNSDEVDRSTCDTEDENSRTPVFKSTRNLSTESTEVEIEENETDGTWTVSGMFKSVFHASPDNKLALKLYGNKKGVLTEQKRQDTECCCRRWMIHPCSNFRYSSCTGPADRIALDLETCMHIYSPPSFSAKLSYIQNSRGNMLAYPETRVKYVL